jgi:hypothetical protein
MSHDEILPMPGQMAAGPGLRPWIVVEDKDQVALFRKEWGSPFRPGGILCWADLPGKAHQIDRLIVYFHANSHSGFRKADRLEHDLRFLVNLESLGIPVRFAKTLSPDQLPPQLRRLAFDSDGKTRGVLPADRVFPGIEDLNGDNAVLDFAKRSFPNLRVLASRLDPKRSLLDVIAEYPRLDILEIGPIKEETAIGRIAGCSIDFLNLEGGSLPSLAGLERLEGLRCLRLKQLDKLEDIRALESCPSLERLEIHSCARLRDYASLLKIPTLQSLFLFRNLKLDKAACAAAFAAQSAIRHRIW